MKIPRILAVFLCAALAGLAVAFIKALVVSGLDTLPPVKVLVFAASSFGLVAALIDWGLLRDLFPGAKSKPPAKTKPAKTSVPTQAKVRQDEPIIERARQRPIVFREICPPPATTGLSFYGGAPVGPATLAWPRVRNKPGDAPLSFIMQWDSAELARQDVTGLLPRDGALYLFGDLTWGEPFDFQFIHAAGPVHGWQALPLPPDLSPIFGDDGAYQVPYCSPQVGKETQDVPRLLPKWPFTPTAFSYPAPPNVSVAQTGEEWYWSEGELVAEALLLVEHPEGVPPATRLEKGQAPFARPFGAFPHDYAAVRVVAAKVLHQLRHPQGLLREASEDDRQAKFDAWKTEAVRRYVSAASHPPGARVEQSRSDEIWHWIEGLEPVLMLGWSSLVEECANVSLGLESEGIGSLPADLVAVCAGRHRLASVYLREEFPNRGLHAPCPNHMFGPPSYVQGFVEEYLKDWILLLELSSRRPIGHEFGEGVLQFVILPSDLRAGRFDRAKLVASAY